MKTAALIILAFALGYLLPSPRRAEAIPGQMCINSSNCTSKCEVCVKEKVTDPTGKCLTIAGCY